MEIRRRHLADGCHIVSGMVLQFGCHLHTRVGRSGHCRACARKAYFDVEDQTLAGSALACRLPDAAGDMGRIPDRMLVIHTVGGQ